MLIRIVKLFLSSFFYIYLKIKLWFCLLFKITIKPKCITLYYHAIYPEEQKNFKRQMDLLKNKFEVLKSDYFGQLSSKKKYAIITFDDGFENLITNAIPILKENKLPFTIFFISNYFGKTPNWEFPEGHRDNDQRIMTVEQMNGLPRELLTIGSHTENHKNLTSIAENEILSELRNSKETLQKISGREISIVSYPHGEYNKSILKKSFQVGYKRVFTIDPKFSLVNENESITGRIWANGNDWYPEFWLKMHGAYGWLNNIFKAKRFLLKFNS